MVYYQYITDDKSVIVQINSSNQHFPLNEIPLSKVLKIKLGKTKESDLVNL